MFHLTTKNCGVSIGQEQESILYVNDARELHFRAGRCVQTDAEENQRELGVKAALTLLHNMKVSLMTYQNALTSKLVSRGTSYKVYMNHVNKDQV